MHKFLSALCLSACVSLAFVSALRAAERQEVSVSAKEDEEWFKADADADEDVTDENIEIIKPRPSEIINSGLGEVASLAGGLIGENSLSVAKPECDNVRLLDKVLARIAEFYKQNPVNNIIDKRRQTLMLKNLRDFKEIDIPSFDSKENYDVSDQIIAYKINKGLKDEDMRLCRSSLPRAIYLLIYPQNNAYTVEIINFPGMPLSKNFTTVYD